VSEKNTHISILSAIQAARQLRREDMPVFSHLEILDAEKLEHNGFSIIVDLESRDDRSLSISSGLMEEGLEFQDILKKIARQQKRSEGPEVNPIVTYLETMIQKIDDLLAIKVAV